MREIYPIENYRNLAVAIVRQAAEDYIDAKKKLPKLERQLEAKKRKPNAGESVKRLETKIMELKRDIVESEQFFLSDRFDIYMPDVNGELFLQELKKKAAREMGL